MKRRQFFDNSYLAKVGFSVAASVLAAGVLFYIGFHLTGNLKDGISTVFAKTALFADSVECSGYILKDETPLENPFPSHSLSAAVENGGRVSVGGKVADAYTSASEATARKIRLITEQIAFYEDCRDTHATIGDSGAVKKSISSEILTIRRDAETGSFAGISAVKKDLLMNISSYGVMTGRVTDFDTRIAQLTSELQSLKATLGTLAGSVFSPSAGYYFAECDGYESTLTSKDIDLHTFSSLTQLLDTAESLSPAESQGDAGKIMHSFKWYVACPMPSTDSARLKTGYSYTVTLHCNENRPLTMKLSAVLSNATESVAVFECTTVDGDFDFTRHQNVSITVDTVPCFEIPIGTVRYYEGMRGVYVLDKTTVVFRRIEVFDERNGYYLCYADVPTEDAEESDETSPPETASPDESEATTEPYYFYLRENDIVITGGTGLYVGMVYNNKG